MNVKYTVKYLRISLLKGLLTYFQVIFQFRVTVNVLGEIRQSFKTVLNRHFRTGGSLEIPPTVPLRKLDTSKVIIQGKIIAVAYTLGGICISVRLVSEEVKSIKF